MRREGAAFVGLVLVAACLNGCGPACQTGGAGFVPNPQGEATPRDAVLAWLKEPEGGARDRDPDSWKATDDPLRFVNGDRTVTVADFTHVPGASGYLVESCA